MLWTFLFWIMISGAIEALPTENQKDSQKDFNLSMYVEAPRPYLPNGGGPSGSLGGSPAAYASAVIVQGWMATSTTGTSTGQAKDVYSCLGSCQTRSSDTDPRCRLVSYNMETGVCTKFLKVAATGTFNSLRFSRNSDTIVAANSEKRFTSTPNVDYAGDDLTTVSNTGSADACKLFCHLHPTCNVSTFGLEAVCFLKYKTRLNPLPHSQGASFVA